MVLLLQGPLVSMFPSNVHRISCCNETETNKICTLCRKFVLLCNGGVVTERGVSSNVAGVLLQKGGYVTESACCIAFAAHMSYVTYGVHL